MSSNFSVTEQAITNSFVVGSTFNYQSLEYTIINSGKPSPSSGECKTDTYILAEANGGKREEFKISIKQENADFLENKMRLERALQIFGNDAQELIYNSLIAEKDSFEDDYLVTFDKFKRTEAKTLKIGWKFELLNKNGGNRSNIMLLTKEQVKDIYAGSNLEIDKRNSKVSGSIIENSGIANFMLVAELGGDFSIQNVINNLIPMDDYIEDKKIYFACKAVNYRMSKDKWDGNRPLSVYVDWSIIENKVKAKIVFDDPLSMHANVIGLNIREILKELNIASVNFDELEPYLSDVKFHREKP
jgi:hypothetical protein